MFKRSAKPRILSFVFLEWSAQPLERGGFGGNKVKRHSNQKSSKIHNSQPEERENMKQTPFSQISPLQPMMMSIFQDNLLPQLRIYINLNKLPVVVPPPPPPPVLLIFFIL
jgi:hypothetical protein